MTSGPSLRRRLGTADAVVIGLSAMIGAGVFAAFAPAAAAAGSALLVGLLVAAVVAFCNAWSSASLAAHHPQSGGAYVYGRQELGPWWGFTAGWSFVVGKSASCAAMALTFASYATPGQVKVTAALAVVALTAVNYAGITRTVTLARVLLALTLLALAIVLVGIYTGSPGTPGTPALGDPSASGVLQSAGLLFFAFAGYARIATLGEEVRDPQRTIRRAIPLALGLVVVLYAVAGVGLLLALGPDDLASAPAPLADAARAVGLDGLAPVAVAGAAVASLAALLTLLTGVGRTSLAMARERDLPPWFAAVHPRFAVPHRAELAIGGVVLALVLTVDLRGAIGFSSFGVLLYYAIANASALRLPSEQRRLPAAVCVLGLIGCLTLAMTLPVPSVVGGLIVLAVGLASRILARSLRR